MRFDARCEENFRRFAARYPALKAQQERAGEAAVIRTGDDEGADSAHADALRSDRVEKRAPRSGLAWLRDSTQPTAAASALPSVALEPAGMDCIEDEEQSSHRSAAHDLTSDAALPNIGLLGSVDYLYLDNTFCHPKYAAFHTTASVLPAIQSVVAAHPACDILLGGDTLGKEDLLVLLSHAMQSKIVVPDSRWRMLVSLAKASVKLNSDVDAETVRKIVTAATLTPAAGDPAQSTPFESPLSSHRHWLSCFSPNPRDGRIKLGPKNQVTAANIEWMNQMAQAHEERKERIERQRYGQQQRQRQKRRRVVHDIVESAPGETEEEAKEDAETDESASDSDPDDKSSFEDLAVGDSGGTLERPVVGILVTGWAIDRMAPSRRAGAAHLAAAADAAVSPESLPANAAIHCRGPGSGSCKVHLLPYSSHSSYSQLRRFVSLVRPGCIRPLCKGDTNPSVMDDLLQPHADTRAIEIPLTMTQATLKHIVESPAQLRAQQKRVEKQTRDLERSMQHSSTSFTAFASALNKAARGGKMTSAQHRVAMPIGEHDDGETKPIDASAAHGSRMLIDSEEHVDLTADSFPLSLPSLEDANGVKHDPAQAVAAAAVETKLQPTTKGEECELLSASLSPSLPRVRSWEDVFAVFEHFPHVAIPGFTVPAPSERHLNSYAYGQEWIRRQKAAALEQQEVRIVTRGKQQRKLPRFLQPQPTEDEQMKIAAAAEAIQAGATPAAAAAASSALPALMSLFAPLPAASSAAAPAAASAAAPALPLSRPPLADAAALFRFSPSGTSIEAVVQPAAVAAMKPEPVKLERKPKPPAAASAAAPAAAAAKSAVFKPLVLSSTSPRAPAAALASSTRATPTVPPFVRRAVKPQSTTTAAAAAPIAPTSLPAAVSSPRQKRKHKQEHSSLTALPSYMLATVSPPAKAAPKPIASKPHAKQ